MKSSKPKPKPANIPGTPGKATGRPSTYTEELADAICERMATGELVETILRDPGMPNRSTIWRWGVAHESFRTAYAQARELQADAIAESVVVISDDSSGDLTKTTEGKEVVNWENVQRSRLRADSRKWLASKISPRWRDKTGVELSNPPGRPLEVQSSTPLTPGEVVEAVGKMLIEAEGAVGVTPVEGASDGDRLRRILATQEPVPPALYAAMAATRRNRNG